MIKNENGKVKTNIPPSGTPFLVAPILGGDKGNGKWKTENGKRKTEYSEYSEYSDFPAHRSPLTAQRSTLPHPSRLKHQTKRR